MFLKFGISFLAVLVALIGFYSCKSRMNFFILAGLILSCIGDVVINMGHLLSFPFAIAGIVFWIWSVKRGVPAAIQRQPYRTPKKA